MKNIALTIITTSISLMSFGQMPTAAFSFNTINPGNICEGGWTTCANTSAGAINYFWEMPGCVPPTTATSSTPGFVEYTLPGTYTITLHAINGTDTNTVSHDIIAHAKPVATVTGAEDLCIDGFMTLGVSPPTTGSWSDIWWDGLSQPTLNVTTNGQYYGSVTDINTCSVNTDTVTIVDGTPAPIITGTLLYCENDSTQLNAGVYAAYLWSSGETVQSPYLTFGVYSVTVTGTNSCIGTSPNVTVVENTLPTPTITLNGSDLQSSEATGNQWYIDAAIIGGATNQLHTPVVNGTYTVEVTDVNSCVGISPDYAVTSVGISEQQAESSTYSYINGQLTILKGSWLLYDLTGRVIANGGAGIYTIPVGAYILQTEVGTVRIAHIR